MLFVFASSRFEIKPYCNERWFYEDEVDVCSDQRQKDASTAIMHKLIELAGDTGFGCKEVWAGTNENNIAANALYRSLNPDDISGVIGYRYALDESFFYAARLFLVFHYAFKKIVNARQ